MDLNAWLTLIVVFAILVGLIRSVATPDVLFLSGLVILILTGVVTPVEAFAGFSNQALLTIAFLFVVAAGMNETGILDYWGKFMLQRATSQRGVIVRMAATVLPMSAFLNNTPIVAMFMPILLDWSRRHMVSPSKVLIPLSFLAILGGTCTLIGTSTNLVVDGLVRQENLKGFTMFEISLIGIPYALVGTIYLWLLGPRLLPERKEMLEQLGESRREYLFEMEVQPSCSYVGKSVEAVGLRGLPGLFLIEIDRRGKIISPVEPDDLIEAGDRLTFTGVVSGIIALKKTPGLIPASDPSYKVSPLEQRQRRICEAVISVNSNLIGRTIREADIRASYGAAVVAVHRGGSRIAQKVGDIRLRPGDTLLMQVPRHFVRVYRNDPAFYLVSAVHEWRPIRSDRAKIAMLIFVLLVLLMSSGVVDLVVAAALAAVLMVGFGCLSAGEARRSIDWQVLITIAAAFGMGAAMDKSGAAMIIAQTFVDVARPFGPLAALAMIYVLGSILTELITNNAAAALLFPFCLATANQFGVSPYPFLVVLMLSASASFVTPIGYQTNMMVFGPGGYRFSDFLKVGLPINLLLMGVALLVVPYWWPF